MSRWQVAGRLGTPDKLDVVSPTRGVTLQRFHRPNLAIPAAATTNMPPTPQLPGQASNAFYVKLMVANARVPVATVQMKISDSWQLLTRTVRPRAGVGPAGNVQPPQGSSRECLIGGA